MFSDALKACGFRAFKLKMGSIYAEISGIISLINVKKIVNTGVRSKTYIKQPCVFLCVVYPIVIQSFAHDCIIGRDNQWAHSYAINCSAT